MSAPALTAYSNGISQVSGDNLNTFLQFATTVVQLRAFNPNPATQYLTVYLQGYSAPDDGGQGIFYWNTGTGTDDGGITTVVPNGSTAGYWSRIASPSQAYTPQSVSNASNVNLTAANVINQILVLTGGTTPTHTFPAAAAIIGALGGQQAGAIIDLLIVSENSGTTLIAPGSGVTFTGNLSTGNFSISATSSKHLKIYIASASAVTVYG